MNKKIIETIIEKTLRSALSARDVEAPDPFPTDYLLLSSGLDSLGFAILVTQLEDGLGYDPFTLMSDPVYPSTYQEFIDIYTQFSDHLELDESA